MTVIAKGATVGAMCRQCDDAFTYIYKGRRCLYCEACSVERKRAHNEATSRSIRLRMGEVKTSASKLLSVACMTQDEARGRLAFWEAAERMLTHGGQLEDLEDVRPMSQQAIQQLERRALLKMRAALGREWAQWKRDDVGRHHQTATKTGPHYSGDGSFRYDGRQ